MFYCLTELLRYTAPICPLRSWGLAAGVPGPCHLHVFLCHHHTGPPALPWKPLSPPWWPPPWRITSSLPSTSWSGWCYNVRWNSYLSLAHMNHWLILGTGKCANYPWNTMGHLSGCAETINLCLCLLKLLPHCSLIWTNSADLSLLLHFRKLPGSSFVPFNITHPEVIYFNL